MLRGVGELALLQGAVRGRFVLYDTELGVPNTLAVIVIPSAAAIV